MEGNLDARPLRVLYRHRWIQTVPETVLQYCIQEMSGPHIGSFRAPTEEDVQKHRVVITTLSTARLLSDLDLPVGEYESCRLVQTLPPILSSSRLFLPS